MKFLIAGYGSVGRRHMRNLIALGETDILFYRTGRSTLPIDELSAFPVFYNLSSALDQKPDAVIIANVTSAHLDVAIPAAEAGCHLFLEKPVSHSMERIEELKLAIAKGGGACLVGFQFRFHPLFLKCMEWLQSGRIGRPLSARAHFGDYMPGWHPWEDYRNTYSALPEMGGGVVLTLCHPIDYLCWFLGDVDSVFAHTANMAGLDVLVEDLAEILLQFRNGAVGSIHLDYYQRPPSYRFEIIGTEGTLQWDHSDNTARLYNASNGDWETIAPPAGFERNDLFLDEMRHFLDVIQGKDQSRIPLEAGIRVQKIVKTALESSALACRVPIV